jgi:excisionase family DNA binding protein
MTFDNGDMLRLAEALGPVIQAAVEKAVKDHVDAVIKPKPWLTTDELAAHLNVPPHVIRDARKRGDISARKVGKQYRYNVEQVELELRTDK